MSFIFSDKPKGKTIWINLVEPSQRAGPERKGQITTHPHLSLSHPFCPTFIFLSGSIGVSIHLLPHSITPQHRMILSSIRPFNLPHAQQSLHPPLTQFCSLLSFIPSIFLPSLCKEIEQKLHINLHIISIQFSYWHFCIPCSSDCHNVKVSG